MIHHVFFLDEDGNDLIESFSDGPIPTVGAHVSVTQQNNDVDRWDVESFQITGKVRSIRYSYGRKYLSMVTESYAVFVTLTDVSRKDYEGFKR